MFEKFFKVKLWELDTSAGYGSAGDTRATNGRLGNSNGVDTRAGTADKNVWSSSHDILMRRVAISGDVISILS